MEFTILMRQWSRSLFGLDVWQGVAMDTLKYHLGPSCLPLVHPAGGLLLKSTPLDTPFRAPVPIGVTSPVTKLPRRLPAAHKHVTRKF
jgi:hypothetical protein